MYVQSSIPLQILFPMHIFFENSGKQEQLECLGSEYTLRYPMITHTIDSYWIQSKKKTKVKVAHWKDLSKLLFRILKKSLHTTHLLKLLDKMCKYEMDPASSVEDSERTRFCPQMDRWTDGRTDGPTRWNQSTPLQLHWAGGIKSSGLSKEILFCYDLHCVSVMWN